jgi:hypothetical protein
VVPLVALAMLLAEQRSPWSRGATWSMHGSLAAVWAMAVAGTLYTVAFVFGETALRRWAATLALWGAAGVIATSAVRGIQAVWLLPAMSFEQHFELPSWLAAAAVLLCLRLAPGTGDRDAEAVIVLVALVAMWLDLWLMAWTARLPAELAEAIRQHGQWLWHIGGKLGVLACVFLGLWCVAGGAPRLQRMLRDERRLRTALGAGLAAFTLALLAALATSVLPGDHAPAVARVVAGATVWLNFGALVLVWRHWRNTDGQFAAGIALALSLALLGYLGATSMDPLP